MLVDEFSGLLKRKDGAGQPLDRRGCGRARRAPPHERATGVDDERDYLMRVRARRMAIESVVVPETWFFRYPESQQAMARWPASGCSAPARPTARAEPALFERRSRIPSPWPCWTPACRPRALPDRCAGHQRARGPVRAPGPVRAQFLWRRAGLPGPLFHRDRRRPPVVRAGDGAVRFQSGNLFDASLAHAPATTSCSAATC